MMTKLCSSSTTFIRIVTTTLFLIIIYTTINSTNTIHHHDYYNLYTSFTSNTTISNHLHKLTLRPHVVGSPANAVAARYVKTTLEEYGLKARIVEYPVLLTYPKERWLSLLLPGEGKVVEFGLGQEVYDGDEYADVAREVIATFHAYGRSGSVVGPVVYVNYGRVEDYTVLVNMGVNVSGAVALARYGEIYRGDIVKNAYEAGAIGVVVYTDKKDFNGGEKWFPDDKWMPPSGVQVGTVYNGAGDPTTPGWASAVDGERLTDEEVDQAGDVPLIPSLPVSSTDGDVIIRAIGGQVADDEWQGNANSPVYRVGPGPGVLNLTYIGDQVINTIENVIGVIEGAVEPDRFVILGNHRDAWTFGAVDPNSGTATLLEVARRLEKLQKRGWKPRRTIILCNWDAEEYGLIGSTEWVEENKEILASKVVAYLNIDIAVAGAGFQASATPQLDELLKKVTQKVQDPDNSSQTVYNSWTASCQFPKIGRLGGGGSDYAPFVQHVGISSVDMSFGNGYPVYHSMYDDFTWMTKFGDPIFHRHVAAASIWGLLALHLSDEEFLPFNYTSYANELQRCTKELANEVSINGINFNPLYKSIEELKNAANKTDNQRKILEETTCWTSLWKKDASKVKELNDRLMMAERAFTNRDGLTGRSWYKHLIYGPSKYDDYGSKSFPGIDDAISIARSLETVESWRTVQHEIWRASRAITNAALVLRGELT